MDVDLLLFYAAMVALTKIMCWKDVAKTMVSPGVGLVIYRKPDTFSCYDDQKERDPPFCYHRGPQDIPWYYLQKCHHLEQFMFFLSHFLIVPLHVCFGARLLCNYG